MTSLDEFIALKEESSSFSFATKMAANETNHSHVMQPTLLQNGDSLRRSVPAGQSYLVWQNGLILFFFSLIVIISLGGNLLVCRTLIAQRRLRANSTNVLIGVLAISDLMMTIWCIPFTIVDMILKDWVFGSFFCTLVSFVQANSVYVSSFTIGVIAINRQRLIYKFQPTSKSPHCPNNASTSQRRQTLTTLRKTNKLASMGKCCCFPVHICKRNQMDLDSEIGMELQAVDEQCQPATKVRFKLKANTRLALVIFAIWLLAALHSLPHTVFHRVKTIHVMTRSPSSNSSSPNNADPTEQEKGKYVTVRRCMPDWPEELGGNFSLALTLFTTLTQYFIPLTCAGAIYTRIGFTIMAQGKVGEMSRGRSEQLTQKKRRRLLMLVSIGLSFALCWLPFNVYYILLDTGITKSTNYTAFLVCLWLATSSVCWNFIIYCLLNENFRRETQTVLQQIKRCCRSSQ